MRFNRLHWIAFGVTVALMFVWQDTPLGEWARHAFGRLGVENGWAWPVCGLAAFWGTYFVLKLSVAAWSQRQARLDDL